MLPILFLGAACSIDRLGGLRRRLPAAVLVAASAASVLYFVPNAAGRSGYFANPARYSPSVFRATFDAIGTRVDPENRLLIVPSSAYYNHGFQLDFYFGKNAEFLVDQKRTETYTPESLERIVRSGRFNYVLYNGQIDLRFTDPNWRSTVRSRPWFKDLLDRPYVYAEEEALIHKYFDEYRLHLIANIASGKIYSRRKRPLFPNSGFEGATLDSWQASGDPTAFSVAANTSVQGPGGFYVESRSRPAGNVGASTVAVGSGMLESKPFRIDENIIGFVIAGSGAPEKVHIALIVDGTELRTGPGSAEFRGGQWDVTAYRGKEARIAIRDLDSDPNSGVAAAGFYYVF